MKLLNEDKEMFKTYQPGDIIQFRTLYMIQGDKEAQEATVIRDLGNTLEVSPKDKYYGDKKIIRKTNVRGALIKDEESLKEDLSDGWTVTDEMEEILDNMEKVVYELRNTFRGYYTQVATYNELADYFEYNMVNSMEEMARLIRNLNENSINESISNTTTLQTKIKDYYSSAYPEEEFFANQLKDNVTFKDVLNALKSSQDVYEVMGCGDSVVREHIFDALANILGVSYNKIYHMWLDK